MNISTASTKIPVQNCLKKRGWGFWQGLAGLGPEMNALGLFLSLFRQIIFLSFLIMICEAEFPSAVNSSNTPVARAGTGGSQEFKYFHVGGNGPNCARQGPHWQEAGI